MWSKDRVVLSVGDNVNSPFSVPFSLAVLSVIVKVSEKRAGQNAYIEDFLLDGRFFSVNHRLMQA